MTTTVEILLVNFTCQSEKLNKEYSIISDFFAMISDFFEKQKCRNSYILIVRIEIRVIRLYQISHYLSTVGRKCI